MPSSTFVDFTVLFENEAGVPTPVEANIPVGVWSEDLDGDVAESPLYTDVNGQVLASTISTIAGDRVHFRVENYNGLSASVTQLTI